MMKDQSDKKELWLKRVFFNPHFIKFAIYMGVIAWIIALGGGYLFAQFDPAGPGLDPKGYSLLVNYISDLGSLNYTPLPKFLDDGLMLTGFFMIPTAIYLRKILSPKSDRKLFLKVLSYVILCVYVTGSIGIFLTGVISEDVGEKFDAIFGMPFPDYPAHDFVADMAFYSFISNGFLIALLLILFPEILRDRIGLKKSASIIARILFVIDIVVISPTMFTIFWISYPNQVIFGMFSSFWEWMLVLSYTLWQIPLSLLLIKPINKEIGATIK